MYTLKSGETIDIRLDGRALVYESCWARVEDVSIPRSKLNLQASAREEQVEGDTLEDFQQTIASPKRFEGWFGEVADRNVFLLNISVKPTVLEVCEGNCNPFTSLTCAKKTAIHVPVNPKQTVVLDLRKAHGSPLIRSAVPVDAVFGFLRRESGTRRTFSTESSIDFDNPPRR